MDNLIIPHFTEGFKLDWTRVIPINHDDLAMYIHPRIAVTFEKIYSPVSESRFSIGYIMENCEDIDCKNFDERLNEFKPFKNARVKRVFDKKRYSIFFDAEEIEILAGIFNKEKFTAIINIYIDGKATSIKDMPLNMFKIVEPLLKHYNVIHPLPVNEYREYSNTKRVKIKRVKKGGNSMGKTILKMIVGTIVAGLGLTGAVLGINTVKDAYDEMTGKAEDIIMAEEDDI